MGAETTNQVRESSKPSQPLKEQSSTAPPRLAPQRNEPRATESNREAPAPQCPNILSRNRNIANPFELPDFDNTWSPKFTVFRSLHDDRILAKCQKNLNADGDDLDIFLSDTVDTASQCSVEVVAEFCRGVAFEDVTKARGRAGHWRSLWLDERSSIPHLDGSGDMRKHDNPLTAYGLHQALMRPRYNHEGSPDAARRLIYACDLDPASIHALAATASCHQAPVLRSAIHKHLTFQTCIGVSFPSRAFVLFELALHLSFFLLRDTPPDDSIETVNTKPQRVWTDLSFLKLDGDPPVGREQKKVWGMYDAHISCVVTGSDEWRWVGYGFVDAEVDGLLNDSSELDLAMDQIAFAELDANTPIWRPRDYWIRVFEIRIKQVVKEWEYLIYKVEIGVYRYTKMHSFTIAARCGIAQEEDAEIKEAFDWTVQAMSLLRRIDGVLSNTVEAWKNFSAADGDIGYFRPTPEASISPHTRRSLHTIRAVFRQLEDTQKKISHLNKCCSEFKGNLQLRLFLQGKETADGNETTSEFTVSVLYPIALAAAIFSMQQQAIPFDLNPRSFILTSALMIIIVYTSRLLVRCVLSRWPLLRRAIVSWLSTSRGQRGVEAESWPRVIGDEERDALGTKVIREIPTAEFGSKAG